MIDARKVAVSIVFFLAVGFFFLLGSETSFAGNGPVGCCVNNSGNCVAAGGTQCGPQDSFCQSPQVGACPLTPNGVCNSAPWNQCFVQGGVCFQVTNTEGECRPAPSPTGPPILGCCGNIQAPPDSLFCDEGVSFEVCENVLDGTFSSAGTCQPDNSCVFTPQVIPTMNQWGGIITAGLLGLMAIFFITRRFVLRRTS